MGCFSLEWIEQLCIWLVLVWAIVMIIRLVIPWLTGFIGIPIIGQILEIVLIAIIAILIIYIIFSLLSCLVGGNLHLLPPMPHH